MLEIERNRDQTLKLVPSISLTDSNSGIDAVEYLLFDV